jgi:hypothetical protein
MSDSFSETERQLATLAPDDASSDLRDQVLADMRRELRSSRWDRRLGRFATFMLLAGVGINAVMALGVNDGRHLVHEPSPRGSLVQTAVAIAQMTDPETGRQMAQQIAAWNRQIMTDEQWAAFQAALAVELHKGSDG